VFHDVPTQEDLQQAEDRLAAVRKNRNSLAVFIVLLLGMLIGAGAVIFLLLSGQVGSSGDDGQRLGQLEAERRAVAETLGVSPDLPVGQLNGAVQGLARERSEVIQALRIEGAPPAVGSLDDAVRTAYDQNANLTRVVEELRPVERYETIHRLREDAGRLRAEITVLKNDPLRSGMPNDIGGGLLFYTEQLPRAWAQVKGNRTDAELARGWEQFLEDTLEVYVAGLESEKAAILAWRPLPQGQTSINVPAGAIELP
jgi:hypothetical protein